jgi:CopG family nickel-responsive transcriptional regulator
MMARDRLVRFGVALEGELLRELDGVVAARGGTRSELFRDLARATVSRAKHGKGVDAIATLTIVYDHHVRDLSERLTDLQHELGDQVRATLHVHINHDLCLEVIVIRGKSDRLQSIADRILALRGVKQGGIEIVAGIEGLDRGHDHRVHGEHGHDEHGHHHGPAVARSRGKPGRRRQR